MHRTVVYAVVIAALVAGVAATACRALAEGRQALTVEGKVSPTEWRDALGVYSQRWAVAVTVRYGDEVYDQWQGRASQAGLFSAPMHRELGRAGEIIEVRVGGAFLYGDRRVEVTTEDLDPELDTIDVGTIAMQRQR